MNEKEHLMFNQPETFEENGLPIIPKEMKTGMSTSSFYERKQIRNDLACTPKGARLYLKSYGEAYRKISLLQGKLFTNPQKDVMILKDFN